MERNLYNELISIIRSVVIDKNSEYALSLTDEECKAIIDFSSYHQIEHIPAYCLFKSGKPEYAGKFYSSLTNTTRQKHELSSIRKALSERNIPFIVLKGPVVRELYPEGWMRNSCDVDVLVREENLAKAEEALVSLAFEKEDNLSAHDVTYKKSTVTIELHYTLIEQYRFPEISRVLSGVWDNAVSTEGSEYVMPDEYYYFYHVSHMVKHFEGGGCGIRPVLDLWMLNHMMKFDTGCRDALLSEGKILKFERELKRLSEYWFSGGDGSQLEFLAQFILSGGAFGNMDNNVAVKRTTSGGRFKYLMKRLFAPYSQLIKYYPTLEKYPILLPYYEVKRWIQAFKRNGSLYRKEFSQNMKTNTRRDEVEKMLDALGMN